MAPLNFARLQSFIESAETEDGIDRLEDSEAQLWGQQLAEFEVTGDEDAEQLRILFKSARALMEYNQVHATAIMEEAEEQARAAGEREDKWEEERTNLKEEISQLRDQLTAGVGQDQTGRTLRAEIDSMREENTELKHQNRERDRELADERDKTERQLTRITELERDKSDLTNRRYQLEDTIKELNRRLSTQQETQTGKKSELDVQQKKLKERNDALLRLTSEYQNLSEENESLQKDVDRLTATVKDATKEMETTTEKYIEVKEALRVADDLVETLSKENEELRRVIEGPKTERASVYQDIMTAVDKKIEEWKALLKNKDEEIARYKSQVDKLHQDISEYSVDADRASVTTLTRLVEDRDKQIQLLKNQLIKATKDMTKTTELVESLQAQMRGDGTVTMQQRIGELTKRVQAKEKQTLEAQRKTREAEQAAADRDKQLAEIIARVRKYEQGEYGLEHAVQEIAEFKTQITFRDKQINELTGKCSHLEVELHEVIEDNDEMRRKLGLDQRKLRAQQTSERVKKESDHALNIILRREIDKLEDERIEMKLTMRKLSQRLGQRAVALGLTADDYLAVEQFTEELRYRRAEAMAKLNRSNDNAAISSQLNSGIGVGTADLARQQGSLLNDIYKNNNTLKSQLQAVETENVSLIQALKDIQSQISNGSSGTIQIPALDSVLARADARHLGGSADLVSELNTKLERMTGRNEQLAIDTKTLRNELHTAKADLTVSLAQVSKLTLEVEEANKFTFKAVQLPDGIPATSSMIIMNLNEHLLQCFQEIALKAEQLSNLQQQADSFRNKLSVLKHAHGLLYAQHDAARKEWQQEKLRMTDQNERNASEYDKSKVQVQEFERLQDTLTRDENEQKRRLGEMTRKFTVMRINESIMVRKYRTLELEATSFYLEKEKVRKDAALMEADVRHRIAYLQKQKELTSFEMATLNRSLRDAVPLADHEAVRKESNNMAEKYRQLLEKDRANMERAALDAQTEVALKQLTKENEMLKRTLHAEKEKNGRYEAALAESQSLGLTAYSQKGSEAGDSLGVEHLTKRIAMLEMKELNDRQSVEQSRHQYERQRDELRAAEERISQLERTVADLGVANLDLQRTEQTLRDELAVCVTKEIYKASEARIADLEKSETTLRADVECFKTMTEVAQSQAEYWQRDEKRRSMEVKELKACVQDIHAYTDHQAIIARLHFELLHLKLTETDATENLTVANNRIRTLETRLLRSDERFDAKERALQHSRTEFTYQVSRMRTTITSLRTRFSGSLPLQEMEKYHAQMVKLDRDRMQIRQQLIQTIESSNDAEERLHELKLRQTGLEELMSTLKEREGAQKIVEWHAQMEQLRLAEMRTNRSLQRSEAENKQLKNELTAMEANIGALEETNVKLKRDFEDQQLQWENREAELEAKNRALEFNDLWEERQMQDIEQGFEGLTDPTLPLPVQLDNALQNLRQQLRKVNTFRKEADQLTINNQQLTNEKRKLEMQLMASDRMSVQMQSAAATTHALLQIDTTHLTDVNGAGNNNVERVKHMAKISADAFKAQLAQKDEALENYKKIVRSLHENLEDVERRYQQQMLDVQRESQRETDERVARMRELASSLGTTTSSQESQILEIAMLKDSVVELENANAALLAKLNGAREEINRLHSELEASKQQKKPSVTRTSAATSPPKRLDPQEISVSSDIGDLGPDHPAVYVEPLPIKEDEDIPTADDADAQQPEVESNRSSANSSPSSKKSSPTKGNKLPPTVDRSKSSKSSAKSLKTPVPVLVEQRPSEPSKKALQWKVENDRLKKERNAAVNEKKALERALEELRADMMSTVSQDRRSSDTNGMKDLEIKSLKQQLETAEEKADKRGRELKKCNNEIDELKSDAGELKGELVRKEGIISRLKQERIEKDGEIENLERRIVHLRESVRMKIQETENRELKKKLSMLEKQMETANSAPAEKPLESTLTATEVARWEEKKRFEQHIDRLKEKLASRTSELDEQKTLGERLRRRIAQLEKENLAMVDRQATSSPSKAVSRPEKKQPGGRSVDTTRDARNEVELAALRVENAQLKKDLSAIQATKVEQSVISATQLVQLKAETDRLEQQISRVSTVVVQSGSQIQVENMGKIEQENSELRDRNAELEVQLSAANQRVFLLEQRSGDFAKELSANEVDLLRRALADAQSESARLNAELRVCQQELAVANVETDELRRELTALQDQLQITDGDRQNRSGAIETVNRLHAVVDRLESENADLRKQVDELRLSSSRLPQDSTEVRRLLDENRRLVDENKRIKQRLERTAPRVAWAEQLTSEEGKGSKLSVDYRRLSRELRKSQLENQETLERLTAVESTYEKLRDDYQRLVQLNSQRRRSHPDSISGVVLIEDKLTAKEALLQTKQERIRQLEEQLRVEVEKNHATQYENRRLKAALNTQNWTPSRDLDGDELTRQIRQLKAEISHLEGENNEFKLELEALNRYIRPAVSASQLDVAQVMQRMKNYEHVLTENIELKLERNAIINGRDKRSS